ncbi:MAG: outer membrane protein assembly factor BamB [Gammaproteobacteria bacterium]|nr:outer membrane protein assembly factor BamB [Gammaproteobacteria bacterium]MDH5629442.1 outer membrane protein assembly factor BamB [Gammaproteobacteria bacterium]
MIRITPSYKLILTLFVSVFFAGCADEDDIYMPNPLVDLDNQFDTDVIWSTSIGDGSIDKTVKLEPVYSDGKIFVADNSGVVAAVDPKNGKLLWETDLETEIGGGPAVLGDILAVGAQQGEVIVLDATSGKVKWRKELPSEIISKPAIGEGHVVVNSVDGKTTALSAENGERKWVYDQTIPSLTLRGNSSPVIVGGGVISGFSNGKLVVFILQNGIVAWEKLISAPIGRSEIQRLVDIDIQPQVYGEHIYVASYNGNLADINARSGEVFWQRELSTYQEISVTDLLLLVTHDNSHVSAVNRGNGVTIWTEKSLYRRILTTPVLVGDYVVVADFEGYLHWLSKKDGQVLSREEIDSDGISAKPLVIDDKIILLAQSGTLYAVRKEK